MRIAIVAVIAAGCGRVDFELGTTAVTIDSTGVDSATATSVTTIGLATLDIGTGADECLIAGLALGNQGATGVTMRWGTTVMTPIAMQPTTGSRGVVVVAKLLAPQPGLSTLTASWTGASDAVLTAVSFAGADPIECARAVTGAGISDAPSLDIPSAIGHVSLDVAVTTNTFVSGTQDVHAMVTAGSRPTLIQQTTHSASGVVTDACTLDAPPAPGNDLVFVGANPSGSLLSLAGGGVTWQVAAAATTHTNVEIWYGEASTGTGTTITYTGLAASSMVCWVGEFAGLAAAPLDAMTQQSGAVGPANPGTLTTTADDLLILGYSSHALVSFGTPTQGPWTQLAGMSTSSYNQTEFLQRASAPGVWSPSIAETSTTDPSWDAVAAGFRSGANGIGGALSTATGATTTTHAWTTDGVGYWASIGVDVFP